MSSRLAAPGVGLLPVLALGPPLAACEPAADTAGSCDITPREFYAAWADYSCRDPDDPSQPRPSYEACVDYFNDIYGSQCDRGQGPLDRCAAEACVAEAEALLAAGELPDPTSEQCLAANWGYCGEY